MKSNSHLSIALAIFVTCSVTLGACAPSGGQQGQTAAPVTWPTSQMLTAIASSAATPEPTAPPIPEQVADPPDLIFFNGRVVTMDNTMHVSQALAIRGDRIVAVGLDEEILALAGPATEIMDLDGYALLPGFVDAHTHILNDAEYHLELTLAEAQDLALENGITTLANMYVEEWFLQELQALEASGRLRVRTSAYLVATDNCGSSLGDWYMAYPPTDDFGEMLRIGGVKLFTDGGTCGYAAVSEETHPGAGQGELFLSDNELLDLVRRADGAGYQVAIHALGDRAINQTIDALNAVIDTPGNPERHRLEHAFYMADGQMDRFSEFGIHPLIFGYWPTCDRERANSLLE